MLTVNDDSMFLPTHKNNLIFNLEKDKDKILQTLDLIQNTFNRNNQNIVNNNCKDSTQIFQAIIGAFLIIDGVCLLVVGSSESLIEKYE